VIYRFPGDAKSELSWFLFYRTSVLKQYFGFLLVFLLHVLFASYEKLEKSCGAINFLLGVTKNGDLWEIIPYHILQFFF
jgi:hypothetical protein